MMKTIHHNPRIVMNKLIEKKTVLERVKISKQFETTLNLY